MRLVYHALGGGHGHVLRGLAVLRRLGGGTLIGPARLRSWADAVGVQYASPPDEDWAGWVAAQPAPDLLLADVFPRGVIGELQPWLGRVPAWLVSRRVVADFYLTPAVRAAIESCFERVLWTEEPPPVLGVLRVAQERVPPALLGLPALCRAEARRRLGVPDGRPLLLGLGSGDAARQARLCRLLGKIAGLRGLALRFVSAELASRPPVVVRLFPAAASLAAADVVVSAAGYHAFHETTAAGVPTVFVPQRRRYDEQWWRSRDGVVAADPLSLERAVASLLREGRTGAAAVADGARAIAERIERRMQPRVLAEEEVAPVA